MISKKTTVEIGGKEKEIIIPSALESDVQIQIWEILTIECYKHGIKKDGVYLDVGANVGLASLYFQPYAKKIYALEPNPNVFEYLKHNTKDYDNIEVFNCGIWAETGKFNLFSNADSDIPQCVYKDEEAKDAITCQFYSLSDFMKDNKIKHVDTMKIDVEGAEFDIFPMVSFGKVAKKIDTIVGETHFTLGGGFPDVIPHLLKQHGYKTDFPPMKNDFKNLTRIFRFKDTEAKREIKHTIPYNTIFRAVK